MNRWKTLSAVLATVLGVLAPSLVRASPVAAADGCTFASGDRQVPITSQGRSYRVLVHVPPRLERTRALVLNMHGATQSGLLMEKSSQMNATADKYGFLVAYPTGGIPSIPGPAALPVGAFWNVAGLPLFKLPVPPGTRDDVRFVVDLAAALRQAFCLDRTRIYATGASNGGIMASYLGCHYADVFAAVAPVMGVRAGRGREDDPYEVDTTDCQPSRPMPIIALHGKKDPVLHYAGDPNGGIWGPTWGYPVETAIARWVALDGCTGAPAVSMVSATITRRTWNHCRDGVSVAALVSETGGHSWWGHPTPPPFNLLAGKDDLSADANEIIWSFLSRYTLPTP